MSQKLCCGNKSDPNRQVHHRQTFSAVERRLRETGKIQPHIEGTGRRPTVRTIYLEDAVLEEFDENRQTSTRKTAMHLNVSHSVVWNIVHDNLLYPFHHRPVQALLEPDMHKRVVFCESYLNILRNNLNFASKILFTDEATFQRHGLTNMHNLHSWAHENPHEVSMTTFQHNFSLNIWAGIVENVLVGPFVLPHRLGAVEYLQFLNEHLPPLLEEVPLNVRQAMWYMHDGAPAHSTVVVRRWLNLNYPNRWIGRGNEAPISWPARSPDLTPMDFFFWGHIKSIVYATPVDSVEELQERIFAAADEIRNNPIIFARVRNNFDKRVRLCLERNGNYFENVL
uniref:Transposable element Tc3 transposase n=1 Tax=Anoplophora glabripennis TaxID=217634 RepID=V5I843_ANOGL